MVHAHDGQIELTSSVGAGSTFAVTVPLERADEITPVDPTDETDGDVGRPDQSQALVGPPVRATVDSAGRSGDRTDGRQGSPVGSRVMVIEDDPDLQVYLSRLLTDDGWDVHAVGDAETALAALLAESDAPSTDLVLTDVMLPGRSGLELVTELRAIGSTARVPIIVLTARGGADAAAEGLATGADDYITKPFTSRELLARVRAIVELHRAREHAIDDAENRARQVRSALDSNRIIGTAIGVLMAITDSPRSRASNSSPRPVRTTTASSVTSPPTSSRPGACRSGPPITTISSSESARSITDDRLSGCPSGPSVLRRARRKDVGNSWRPGGIVTGLPSHRSCRRPGLG